MVFACALQGEAADGWDKARPPGVRSGRALLTESTAGAGNYDRTKKCSDEKSFGHNAFLPS